MQASVQPQVFLDLRYESSSQVLAASVHRQLTGAVSQPHGKMSATALMSMESAALPSQLASKLSCVHPYISCTTLLLLSTFVLSCQGFSGRFGRLFVPRIGGLSNSMGPEHAYTPAPVDPPASWVRAAMPEATALIYENREGFLHQPPFDVLPYALHVLFDASISGPKYNRWIKPGRPDVPATIWSAGMGWLILELGS